MNQLSEMAFEQSFGEFQQDAFDINETSGFNDPDKLIQKFSDSLSKMPYGEENWRPLVEHFKMARAGLKLMLITSEASEALEAVRKNLGPDEHIPEFTAEEAECADAVIRFMNYASGRRLRLAAAMIAKQKFNRTRADHKRENREKDIHGKQF